MLADSIDRDPGARGSGISTPQADVAYATADRGHAKVSSQRQALSRARPFAIDPKADSHQTPWQVDQSDDEPW